MVSSIQSSFSTPQTTGLIKAHRALSDDQKQTVQEILSKFDSSKVTTADAKSIFKSFEEAGIKGAGLREAITTSGFDADQVFSLAHDGQKPPMGRGPGGPGGPGGGAGKVNASALQTLQTVLNQYDLTSMSDEDEQDLMSKLKDTGLLQSGSLLNLGA